MSRSFEKYIASIEQECQPYGICKITAAKGWTPCSQGYTGQDFDWEIARIEQNITRETMASGVYTAAMTPLRKQSVRFFKEATEVPSEKRLRPPAQHLDNLPGLESAYWRTIPGNTEYGADNEGSLFDEGIKGWNLARLDSCLSRGLASDPAGQRLKGVNTPYLYYGRWKATFAWHTEDMDLHSVNYLHYGAPKVWYCIPPSDRQKMDAFVAKKLYAQHGRCREFMRHKTVLIKPDTLEAAGITVQKVVQHPGDFIINFPGAYHSGFNVGFNCAESTNFATTSWIQHGAIAQFCRCTPGQEPVRLDMGLFLSEAPDDHTRQLVRQRMARDRAARGVPVDAGSDADAGSGSGSDQDSCNLRCKHSRAKPRGKAATDRGAVDKPVKAVNKRQKAEDKPPKAADKPQKAAETQRAEDMPLKVADKHQKAVEKPQRAEDKPLTAAGKHQKAVKKRQKAEDKPPKTADKPGRQRRSLRGQRTCLSRAEDKPLTAVDKHLKAVKKPQRAVKQIKRALNSPGRGKRTKADTKQVAAALKAAKQAEQAPAAAAKLPQPVKVLPSPPVSPSVPPRKPTKASASPSKARGRPKGSSKVATAAAKPPMAHQHSLAPCQQQLPQQQQEQSPRNPRHQQQEQRQEQRRQGKRLLEQTETSDGPQAAHVRKRRRMSVEDRLRSLRQRTTAAIIWVAGLSDGRQAPGSRQAEYQVDDGHQIQPRQPPQHAHHAQHAQHAQRSTSGQGSSTQQWQDDAQGGLGQQESDDNDAEVASTGEADSGGLTQMEAAAANADSTQGEPMAKESLPISDILKWRGTRTRSQRSSHRAGGEGCPSSFQKLLSR
ncbi:TPA: hypothetical protein ACH3X1_008792 [Trebouxia sp. C0004]